MFKYNATNCYILVSDDEWGLPVAGWSTNEARYWIKKKKKRKDYSYLTPRMKILNRSYVLWYCI